VVIADVQTAGRGRRGRSWVAPKGKALTMSIVLRPSLPPSRAPELTLVAAVAVAEAARELARPPPASSGPTTSSAEAASWRTLDRIARGAGPHPPRRARSGVQHLDGDARLPRGAARHRHESIGGKRRKDSKTSSLRAPARAPEEWLSLHETEGFGPVRERWRELSSTLGHRVRITGRGPAIEGDAADLDEDGALLVRRPGGQVVRVMAGDVEHCRVL